MNLTIGSVCSMIPVPESPRASLTLLDGTGQSYGVLGFAVVVSAVLPPDAGGSTEATTVLEPVICHESRFGPASALLVDSEGLPVPYEVRSDEHTSELQSLMRISYAFFCLK